MLPDSGLEEFQAAEGALESELNFKYRLPKNVLKARVECFKSRGRLSEKNLRKIKFPGDVLGSELTKAEVFWGASCNNPGCFGERLESFGERVRRPVGVLESELPIYVSG